MRTAEASSEQALVLLPVGGWGQVGMNCLALQQGVDRVAVDCGVTFSSEPWGVEAYRPCFEPLLEPSAVLRGLVLTHGHEDHIGAVPELLRQGRLPVWGPAYAIELLRHKLAERSMDPASYALQVVRPGERFDVGSFQFEAVRVAHSTPDALALAIRTVAGLVVHSGDFKLDGGGGDECTDERRLCELGDEGVRVLLADSTNSGAAGRSGSEEQVIGALERIVGQASGRVIIGLFASNVRRLQTLGDIAERQRRYLCTLGRSVGHHVQVASQLGRLSWPADRVLSPALARQYPRQRLLYVASGTQGEPRGALWRLAHDQHSQLTLEAGDAVVLSSRTIPGHERVVQRLIDELLRRGVSVHAAGSDGDLHVSGHAHREEQEQLIEWLRPSLFVPAHGSRGLLERHAATAVELGVDEASSVVLDNGQGLEITASGARPLPAVDVAAVALGAEGELSEPTLLERRRLGRAGAVWITVALGSPSAVRISTVGVEAGALASRGQAAGSDEGDDALASAVRAAVARIGSDAPVADVQRVVDEAARRLLRAQLGTRPVVVVHVLAG